MGNVWNPFLSARGMSLAADQDENSVVGGDIMLANLTSHGFKTGVGVQVDG